MQNLKQIKKLSQKKSQKLYAMTQMIKQPDDNQNLCYSIIQRSKNQQSPTTLYVKNLDNNKVMAIDKQQQIDKILENVQQIPQIQQCLENIWNKYLNDVQKQQQQFLQACYQGDINAVNRVIFSKSKHPIDPKKVTTIQGQNGIHLATISGSYRNRQIIQLLVKNKVDINQKTLNQQRTPLMLGCILGNPVAVKALLELGADHTLQDFQGNTALHLACIFNQQAIVEILIQFECSIDIKNYKQQSPIQCIQTIQIFQLIKADSNYGRTIMKQASLIIPNSRYDHIQKLMQKVNRQDAQTQTQSIINKKNIKSRNQQKRQKIKQIMIKQIKQISLSSFKKLSLLGKGAFGQVFLVENTVDGKRYAMKSLDKGLIMRQNILRYAMTQRKILSTINHPFVIKLYFAFQTSDKLFLVMEYCPGGDLLRLIKKKGKLQEKNLRKYICQLILAIQQLHRAEIIYRDLKPGNVVLDKDGHACLTDFGLSKQASLSHSFCGSTAYLAPQMLWRRGHTKVLDWYLLGVLIYECLTGRPPFWDNNKEQLLLNIKSGRYKPLGAQYSKQVCDLIDQLLKSNANKRLGKNGSKQIKKHPWFDDVNWNDVQQRKQQMDKIQQVLGKPIKQQSFEQNPNINNHIEGWQFKPQN